jgi:hypothetical protein
MFHGGKWHPEEGGFHLALLFDGVVFILTLLAVGAICECCFRRWQEEGVRHEIENGVG